jgi:membrane-bound serine protease (ClpP class)
MRRSFPALLLFAAALWWLPAHAPAATPTPSGPALGPGRAPSTIDVVKVNGVVDRPMADYVISTLREAESQGHAVIIQLNTPGSLGVNALSLADQVFQATVPVVVWIGPTPAHAMGVGLALVYASSYAVVAPGAGVGPMEPLDLGPVSSERSVFNPEFSWPLVVDRWASARGRDASFADRNAEAPGQAALDAHVVQDFAASSGELLRKLNGVRVPTADGEVRLRTTASDTQLRFHDLGIGRRILHAVASPVTIYVLLVLGMMGLIFELTQAGVGVAGIAGAVAIGLAVYGLVVVPFDAFGLGLLVGGLVLLSLDVLLRRLGWISLLGMIAFVAGSYLTFHAVAPAIDVSPWLIWPAAVVVFLYYGFGMTVAQKSRERIVATQRGLVGLLGEARGLLAPEGPVYVKGAMWRGRALDGPIPAGTRIRVRRVDGLILRVEPEPGSEPGESPD